MVVGFVVAQPLNQKLGGRRLMHVGEALTRSASSGSCSPSHWAGDGVGHLGDVAVAGR